MTSAIRPAARKSIPLTERDLEDLDRLRASAAHREALARLVQVELTGHASDARLLHAVLEAGIGAVREQVEEDGYARIAVETDGATRRASARRRTPSWAHE